MGKIELEDVRKYVEQNIHVFHDRRLASLKKTDLKDLLRRKNPYLFKAKHIETAHELVVSLLEAKLSSSEEEIIGDWMEDLAIFIARKTLNAHKSALPGIDFEYDLEGVHYLFAVKSGLNWGNSSQWDRLEDNFKKALKVLSQSQYGRDAKCYLGAAYGRAKETLRRGIIHQVCGQQFWYMISGQESFYKAIVEPIGYKAKEHNADFAKRKAGLTNKMVAKFISDFCDKDGKILWHRIVQFNSANIRNDG